MHQVSVLNMLTFMVIALLCKLMGLTSTHSCTYVVSLWACSQAGNGS